MVFAIKARIDDPGASSFVFADQKTMYGGKGIAEGDVIFVFASENEGGAGLVARVNFKLYRQATNKIVGLSDAAAAFLRSFF